MNDLVSFAPKGEKMFSAFNKQNNKTWKWLKMKQIDIEIYVVRSLRLGWA